MLFPTAFNTVLGLLMAYLILSLLCTSINEAIAGIFRLRGRVLYAEISRMIGDEKVKAAFWNTGIVMSLGRHQDNFTSSSDKAPSYLESNDFALALIDALRSVGAEPNLPSNDDSIDSLLKKIDKDSILFRAIKELDIDLSQSSAEAREVLGAWFDRVMDRASGVYKRYMSTISFVVALFIVTIINADTLNMARTLWQDDAMRTSLIESIDDMIDYGEEGFNQEDVVGILERQMPLPIGWVEPYCSATPCSGETNFLFKALGLLLTAFAVTLGAPFWFDLLSRFAALRNAGPLQAKEKHG